MFGMGAVGHAARVCVPVSHGGAVVTSTHLLVDRTHAMHVFLMGGFFLSVFEGLEK